MQPTLHQAKNAIVSMCQLTPAPVPRTARTARVVKTHTHQTNNKTKHQTRDPKLRVGRERGSSSEGGPGCAQAEEEEEEVGCILRRPATRLRSEGHWSTEKPSWICAGLRKDSGCQREFGVVSQGQRMSEGFWCVGVESAWTEELGEDEAC
eukprot:6019-Rhodomonas_salina.2